jgi:hypothetical protein
MRMALKVLSVFRAGAQPFHIALFAGFFQDIVAFDGIVAGQQGGRAGTQCAVQVLAGDLGQVLVVNPQRFAITDNQLFVGLVVTPAEFAGAGDFQLPLTSSCLFLALTTWVKLADRVLVSLTKALSWAMAAACTGKVSTVASMARANFFMTCP